MTKRLLTLALVIGGLFFNLSSLFTQSKNPYKYGKIEKEELEMQVYPADSSAVALILFHDGFTDYSYVNKKFVVITEVKKRIKILKQEGLEYATVTLRYYHKTPSMCEDISKLEACAYNLEGDKIIKTKLENKYIFEERISEYYREIKFAIPNVKVGTVIEYKYNVVSDFYYELPTWFFQTDIPVLNGLYEVIIPEYFVYNFESRGFEKINMEEGAVNKSFTINANNSFETITCQAKNVVFKVNDIPALKDDSYVWNLKDFLCSIRFELSGTRFPYELYKNYTTTWDDIETTLKEKSDFERYSIRGNAFSKVVPKLITPEDTELTKIEKIYKFVKENISWNEKYAFISNPSEAIKDGTGDNAQINSAIISMLRDAGINAYPILMSRRSIGRLPLTHPSIDWLNTYIVMAETSSGERYFMDGSAFYGGLNMLPTDLLVDKARIFGYNSDDKWIDLTNISKNQSMSMISAKVDSTGNISGECNQVMTFQPAYQFKKMYHELNDSTGYVEKLNQDLSVEIDNFTLEGQNDLLSNRVNQRFKFTKNYGSEASFLYINPLIFNHISKNNFTQSDRKLPVEFSYPYKHFISVLLELPANYSLEEIPKSEKFILNNNSGSLTYLIKQISDRILQINYRFELNEIIFPQTEYENVKTFWGQIATKNNELIVLKKI
jgi:hypothetical protein